MAAAAVVEQRIRDIAGSKNQWKTLISSSNGGRTMRKPQGHVKFNEMLLGKESTRS